jgi:hypothetical protein
MRMRLLLGVASALGTLVSATPALAVEPVVVVASERPEYGPAASTTYLAWTVIRYGLFFPHEHVRAQAIGGDTSFRVNPKGTDARVGGIDGSTLAYRLETPDEKSNLAMIDLSTRTDLDVPEGVNTDASEYSPSIAGTHLLFGRGIRHGGGSIVLFDTSTGTSQVLYSKTNTHRRRFLIAPGQVNGNYAVWEQLVFGKEDLELLGGDVWLHDIAAGTTTKIPSAEGVWQSSPSVDTAGTVYFRRKSSFNCGDTKLVTRQIDGTESILYTFPRSDFYGTVAVDNADGATDLYFDGGSCEDFEDFSDIWKLPGV